MSRHAVVVRLDGMGDVLVCGPAIRAVAAGVDRVTVLAGPAGAAAARLLPHVDEVIEFAAPWILADPPRVVGSDISDLVHRLVAQRIDEALVLTSFHQSALPAAMLLRLAGVPHIAAACTDYPGSLLDVRVPEPPDAPEPERMLAVARAAGYRLPVTDDGRLRVRPDPSSPPGRDGIVGRYVVVHPGAEAPSRMLPPDLATAVAHGLAALGITTVLTGSADEAQLTGRIAAVVPDAVDLTGRLTLRQLADVLAGAEAMVCGNTGPGHLAAAVGTPVVSVFAPVVSCVRWAPYGRTTVLGDQDARCRNSRARMCPVPGHPCVTGVRADEVLAAVRQMGRSTVGA